MRTLVIGDVHGGLKALKQVLKRAKFDNTTDKLIFIGDYVDGWPETSELISFLITLQAEAKDKHIFLRGNHDVWLETFLTTGIRHPYWFGNGGHTTYESYLRTSELGNKKHIMFLYKLHDFYIDAKNRVFVHGGFRSHKGVGFEDYRGEYHWNREMWDIALSIKDNNKSKNIGFLRHKEVFIGHTSTTNWKVKPYFPEYKDKNQPKNSNIIVPMHRSNVWNLDTGGGWEGKLTIMDIDSKKYWQSDYVYTLYPNIKGRQ